MEMQAIQIIKKWHFSTSNKYGHFERKKTTAPTDSHLVTHGNTKGALDSLTLEIKRDPVLSIRYGHSWKWIQIAAYNQNQYSLKSSEIVVLEFESVQFAKSMFINNLNREHWLSITAFRLSNIDVADSLRFSLATRNGDVTVNMCDVGKMIWLPS